MGWVKTHTMYESIAKTGKKIQLLGCSFLYLTALFLCNYIGNPMNPGTAGYPVVSSYSILRVGSKITWHSVGKMSSHFGTFVDSLCQVIFVRSLIGMSIGFVLLSVGNQNHRSARLFRRYVQIVRAKKYGIS